MTEMHWRKSSRSGEEGNCVETGWAGDVVGYRDSKQAALSDNEQPTLMFARDAVTTFLTMIKTQAC